MTTKSICLLLLFLPLACSSAPASNTAELPPIDVPTAGIVIRPKVMRPVLVGGVKQFAANAPVGSITWQSSNPEVAMVSETGLVRGIKTGNSTISASVTYPNGTRGTASVDITVRPQAPDVSIASRRHHQGP